MDLLDLIPPWIALAAFVLAAAALLFLLKTRVIHTLADPLVVVFFQIAFTFSILMLCGLLQIEDAVGFLMFGFLVWRFCRNTNAASPLISTSDWIAFVKAFSIVLFVVNIYLIKQKGLLILSDDLEVARGEFYQGWGLFRRFNEIGIGLVMVTSALLWQRGERRMGILMGIFSGCLTFTLGSRGGLLTCFVAFGAYLHFQRKTISNLRIVAIAGVLGLSSIFWFFLMFGPSFLFALGYRVLAFCDGPFYYFYDRMYQYSRFPLHYPFEIVLVNLRILSNKSLDSLGDFVVLHHFGTVIESFGPNPQMFVESHAVFYKASILWYLMLAGLLIASRRIPATPFSFFLGCFIMGPALIDSQYAASQVFTVALVVGAISAFLGLRWILRTACLGVQQDLAAVEK